MPQTLWPAEMSCRFDACIARLKRVMMFGPSPRTVFASREKLEAFHQKIKRLDMQTTDCHASLQAHLESLSKMTADERRLLKFEREEPKTKREKRVHERRKERMEQNVRLQLFESGSLAKVMEIWGAKAVAATELTAATAMTVAIDWSAIDWAQILSVILPLLLKIIMMFL